MKYFIIHKGRKHEKQVCSQTDGLLVTISENEQRLDYSNKVLIVTIDAGLSGAQRSIKKLYMWLKVQGSLSKGIGHVDETRKPPKQPLPC